MESLRAFIVEDSPVIRENLIATLEEMAPVRVVGTAEDQAGAMDWLATHSDECDLLIVDVFLRAGSGLGVLRAAGDLHDPLNAVVLTNYATADMRNTCLGLGAHKVFDKSNEIDDLIAYCARLVATESQSVASH